MFREFLDAIFPPRCPGCDAIHRQAHHVPFCPTCCAATTWLGHHMATAHFPEPVWTQAVAVCKFEGPITQTLHQFKYERRLDLARPLAQLLADAAGSLEPFDLVVPVPLAAARLRQRGYNQAALLARRISRLLRCEVASTALRRIRATPPQVGLEAKARLANVRGAFAVAPGARAQIRGRKVVLIDDVMTTGATLHACAELVEQVGAARVSVLTVALA